ncbi:MAG: carotenoid oxygenase family protein [Blastocatellia bacterium]|nr:carotenoid oxygenase family protein [Blastocatellia bacterium]
MNHFSGMTRREFARLIGTASALGVLEPQLVTMALADNKRSLNYLANRTAGAEGNWELKKIEGKVPKALNGTLIRTAPGQKETFGVPLQHLFDGDAYLSKLTFREGKVSLQARFLDTPQRVEEQQQKRMLYNEVGTLAPSLPEGYNRKYRGKNQPSVNIIRWDGRYLGLSEGGPPVEIDPNTLGYKSEWNFYGTLPGDVPFTAHPKFDPVTGEGYAYGIKRGMGLALTVFRMEKDGKLKQLYSLPQPQYFMVHDMLLSKDHLIFVMPPVWVEVAKAMSGKVAPFQALRFGDEMPTKIVILRKDGTGKPITINQPANMVFHNGNAFEKDGKLQFDSILSPDGSVLKAVGSFDAAEPVKTTPNHLTRLTVDLAKGELVSRNELEAEVEFPRFDERLGGTEARYLYTGGFNGGLSEATAIVKHDLHRRTSKKIQPAKGRTYAESVFVPQPGKISEDQGWLLTLGYDANQDQTFLEIRDAATMDFQARVWAGIHYPLGFHGNFYANVPS